MSQCLNLLELSLDFSGQWNLCSFGYHYFKKCFFLPLSHEELFIKGHVWLYVGCVKVKQWKHSANTWTEIDFFLSWCIFYVARICFSADPVWIAVLLCRDPCWPLSTVYCYCTSYNLTLKNSNYPFIYLFFKFICEIINWLIVTYPMTAKAGSSWRSKGKSSRKRVLKRAVMVSGETQSTVGVRNESEPLPKQSSKSWDKIQNKIYGSCNQMQCTGQGFKFCS